MATTRNPRNWTRPCPRCNGRGTVALSAPMLNTLKAVRHGATLRQVCEALGVNWNTANARMVRLVELDLVRRELLDDGQTYQYTANYAVTND